MGVAALLAGLVAIIVILGFVTSLQNRFSRSGRGRKRHHQSFEDEFNASAEEIHSPHYHKKSVHHENGPHRQHKGDLVRQQVSTHHSDHPDFSENHRHYR